MPPELSEPRRKRAERILQLLDAIEELYALHGRLICQMPEAIARQMHALTGELHALVIRRPA